MPEPETNPAETPRFDPSQYRDLGEKTALDTLSWYLIATGVMALLFAALCLIMDRTGHRDFFAHKDFSINPNFLGRWLLMASICLYGAGRAIVYYQRFSKRKQS